MSKSKLLHRRLREVRREIREIRGEIKSRANSPQLSKALVVEEDAEGSKMLANLGSNYMPTVATATPHMMRRERQWIRIKAIAMVVLVLVLLVITIVRLRGG